MTSAGEEISAQREAERAKGGGKVILEYTRWVCSCEFPPTFACVYHFLSAPF